jgi:hypothetical protein
VWLIHAQIRYLKGKINELETNSKSKNIRDLYRGINGFKKGYKPKMNSIKDENGDLFAGSHIILHRWKNYFCQILDVRGVNNIRQTEIHTAEPLVPELHSYEVAIAVEKLKMFNLPSSVQIQAELIQVGGKTLHSETHKLVNSIWSKK